MNLKRKQQGVSVEGLAAEIKGREEQENLVMEGPLHPPISTLVKLVSIAVLADEYLSPGGHRFDLVALQNLLRDPEIESWLESMQKAAFVPVKR